MGSNDMTPLPHIQTDSHKETESQSCLLPTGLAVITIANTSFIFSQNQSMEQPAIPKVNPWRGKHGTNWRGTLGEVDEGLRDGNGGGRGVTVEEGERTRGQDSFTQYCMKQTQRRD